MLTLWSITRLISHLTGFIFIQIKFNQYFKILTTKWKYFNEKLEDILVTK
jgi:hypothetical protein